MFGAISTGISLILFAVMPVGASYWTYTFFAQMLTVLGADCGKSGLPSSISNVILHRLAEEVKLGVRGS